MNTAPWPKAIVTKTPSSRNYRDIDSWATFPKAVSLITFNSAIRLFFSDWLLGPGNLEQTVQDFVVPRSHDPRRPPRQRHDPTCPWKGRGCLRWFRQSAWGNGRLYRTVCQCATRAGPPMGNTRCFDERKGRPKSEVASIGCGEAHQCRQKG